MKRMQLSIIIVVLAVLMSAGTAHAAVTFTTKNVETSINPASAPNIDGKWVVYEKRPWMGPPDDYNISAYNIDTGQTTTLSSLAETSDDQRNPDVAADRIVYDDDRNGNLEIYAYNLRTGTESRITNSADAQRVPKVSGYLAVWFNDTDNTVEWYDFRDGTSGVVPGSTGVGASQYDVDGETIVFALGELPVRVYRWVPHTLGGAQLVYTATDAYPGALNLHNMTIGCTLPLGIDPNIYYVDARRKTAASEAGPYFGAQVFHKNRAWGWDDSDSNEIRFRNGVDGALQNVSMSTYFESSPALYGNRVAYRRDSNNGDILLASAKPSAERTSGSNRYATAVEISKAYYTTSRYAVLCTGENFPDALTAAPLARLLDAPLLLTEKNTLPTAVINELDRLDVQTIYVVGGPGAIADPVLWQLTDSPLGYDVQPRLAGADRYETAVAVADELTDLVVASGRTFSGRVFIARGDSFPDALAAGPAAAASFSPILLTTTAAMPEVTYDAVAWDAVKSAVIIGGTSVITDTQEQMFADILAANGGSAPERWYGSDRYGTAAQIARKSIERRWLDVDMLGIATGLSFPDALAGGAACSVYGSPLLLTDPTSLPSSLNYFINEHDASVGRVDVFGGTSVVSDAAKNAIMSELK